jgi:hypothetical protein
MVKLVCKTQPGWLDRKASTGFIDPSSLTANACGKGQTQEIAERNALRNWHAAFGEEPD